MKTEKGNKALRKGLRTVCIIVGIFVLWMVYRVIDTQAIHGDEWRQRAAQRENIYRADPARRGTIFSSDDKVLAITVPVCDLILDLGVWPKKDAHGNKMRDKNGVVIMESSVTNDSAFRANLPEVCRILHAQFPKKSVRDYYDLILNSYNKSNPPRSLVVEHSVPYSQWLAITRMEGWGRCVVKRTVDNKSLVNFVRSHIYGNMGENTIGIRYNGKHYTGLEGYYDSVLRGQDGEYYCRRLTRGVWLPEDGSAPEDTVRTRARKDGCSIVATLDTRYQDIAECALRNSMNQYGGQRGCAILMEVKTGYVLACSSLTRDTSGGLSERLWSNVAVSDRYQPGSTFKTVAMMSMLSDRKIDLDTSKRVQSGGRKSYSSKSGVIDDDHGYNTDTSSLAGVLAKSSNVGMCELAWQYYRNRRNEFRENVEKIFPFGQINPDVAVVEPRTYVVKLASDRDFLNLSYGYSCVVSPLQLITFYNAIANDGCMVKPLFCREILDGRRKSVVDPVVINPHAFSPELAKQMREMLMSVVEHGTGNNIRNSVYGIVGKTGTTTELSNKSIKNSSFVGFFPADNPRYTCLVLVEQTSIAGRMAAAPVFKQIADCVVAFDTELGSVRLQDSGRVAHPVVTKGNAAQLAQVHQLLGLPYSVIDSVHSSTGWVVFDTEHESYQNYVMPSNQVPDCTGMTVRDAMRLLRGMGLKVKFTGQGKVVSQNPKGRSPFVKGATVMLVLEP